MNMLLLQAIRQHAERTPHNIALQDSRYALSYATLWQQIQQRAAELRSFNVHRLVVALDNGIEWALTDLSALYAGITVIPAPHFFSTQQQEWLLNNSRADSLLTDSLFINSSLTDSLLTEGLLTSSAATHWELAGTLTPAIAPTTSTEISIGTDNVQSLPSKLLQRHNHQGYSALAHVHPASATHPTTAIAKITFTSGTTGQPKGVYLSVDNLMQTTQSLADAVRTLGIQRHLTVLPLTTLLENITGLYVPLLLGATSLLPSLREIGFQGSSRLDPTPFLRCLQTFRPHSMVLVPELLRLLIALAPNAADSLHELRFVAVGGGRVAASLLQQAEKLHLPVYQGYGLSECGSVVSL
ncbi:MAG: AMP-binding protein, partial [Plesiomonas sp.]